jgi:hypothetical protein
VPKHLSLWPRSLGPFLGVDLACTPAERTQGARSPPQDKRGRHPPWGGLGVTWGSGARLGARGAGATAAGRPQRWGRRPPCHSQASSSPASLGRPDLPPALEHKDVCSPSPLGDPAQSPGGRPAPVTAQPVSAPAWPAQAHGWLLTAKAAGHRPLRARCSRQAPMAAGAMSLTPLDAIHQAPLQAGAWALPDPCQPCPAAHGASVPGGRGRSHQDPEALHPGGPAPSLELSSTRQERQ